jgi:hypothetical protein
MKSLWSARERRSLPTFVSCPIGYCRMVINRFGFMSEMKASEKHS